jgi:hypothetical protein
MNLNQYKVADAADKGAEMVVRDIYGDPTDATITLLGQDSQVYRKRWQQWQADLRKKTPTQQRSFDFKAFMDKTYKMCIVGWKGIGADENTLLEFTPDNVDMVLDDANNAYIFDQIREFVDDRANFTKSNAKN